MKILGILVVKNEVDILEAALVDAARWADRVFVLDNGSTDGTWELLNSLASDVIVPAGREPRPFQRSFRADIFNRFRGEANDEDWWCKMDSDEFYIDDPRTFLAAVPRRYHVVFKKSVEYRLTFEDLAEHVFTGRFEHDRPLIRYVNPVCLEEMRFFRHYSRLRWESSGPNASDQPRYLGVHYPKSILARHYRYRSPQQMQERLDIRHAIPKDSEGRPFRHVTEKKWEELLAHRADVVLDEGPETYTRLRLRRPVSEAPIRAARKRLMRFWSKAGLRG
jgi:glycosyltransferase involved in cell wall biosynthesis